MIQSQQKQKKQQEQMRYTFIAMIVSSVVMLGGAVALICLLQAGSISTRASIPTTKLTQGTYSNTIDCSGMIEPVGVHDIHAPIAGKVVSVAVHEGDSVAQGTPLFVLQPATTNAQTDTGSSLSSAGNLAPEQVEITADSPGTVMNLNIAAGYVINEPEEMTVLQIADMNVLVGAIQLPDDVVPYIKRGVETDVMVPSKPGYKLKGTLVNVANETSTDTDNRTYRKAIIMFGDTDDLKVGDKITAQIDIDDYGKVYYAPSTAVLEQDGYSYVDIVLSSNTIERHQVRLLGVSDDGQKIIAGDALAEGTTVRADLNT